MKRIVLITDGRSSGWDVQGEGRWRYVADTLKALPSPPQFICRRLPLPSSFRNVSVSDIVFSRAVVGMDRPVKLDVKISNSGTVPIQPSGVELLIDGMSVAREAVMTEIPPGSAETLRFDYRFETPGRHVMTARAVCEDDLPADNSNDRVVDVLDRLPVLVVDGAPNERFFQGAAAFLRLALTPRADESGGSMEAGAAPRFLIEPQVIPVTSMQGMLSNLDTFRVVILANVPRLPKTVTARLEDFVRQGGGLLIAPGKYAEPEFYNTWRTPTGEPILPATLIERESPKDSPARFELRTFTHPALRLVSDAQHSDAGSALIRTFWRLSAGAADPNVRVAGAFDSGEPVLVERKYGKGYVLMTAFPFDRRDSNVPSLKCFLPMIHELVYYLAAPLVSDANIRPGAELVLELNTRTAGLKVNPAAFQNYRAAQNPPVEVLTPSTNRLPATAKPMGDSLVIRFADTQEPGLYHVLLPPVLATSITATNAGDIADLPFVVVGQGLDGSLNGLTETDMAQINSRIGLFMANSREDLVKAFGGEVPGREIWKWLTLGALLLVVAEIGVTRWIALQRRFTSAEMVTLHSPVESVVDMKHLPSNRSARKWA